LNPSALVELGNPPSSTIPMKPGYTPETAGAEAEGLDDRKRLASLADSPAVRSEPEPSER
jgi:hypothetical protein